MKKILLLFIILTTATIGIIIWSIYDPVINKKVTLGLNYIQNGIKGGLDASNTTKEIEKEIEELQHDAQTQNGVMKSIHDNQSALNKKEVEEKILSLKRKIIRKAKAEQHSKNGEYTHALMEYLRIYKERPNDKNIIQKIGDTYFSLKKYQHAYRYYEKIKDYRNLDVHKAILAYLYGKNEAITKENLLPIMMEINTFPLSDEEIFYYKNSLYCIEFFSGCKQKFHNYFGKKGNENLIFKPLINIYQGFENYNKFQMHDIYYKDAITAGEYFRNKLYPISIHISKKILAEKEEYRPILKILAKSYYDLGDYKEAKNYLMKYTLTNQGQNVEGEIHYFLGIVYQKLHDYVLSSIHLKKAGEKGHSKSLDIKRRIAYNYSEVGENEKMLKILEDIVKNEPYITMNDMTISIYHHIIHKQFSKAKELSTVSIEKHKKNIENTSFEDEKIKIYYENQLAALYGYLGWAQIETKDISGHIKAAKSNIEIGLQINPDNIIALYGLGKLHMQNKEYEDAIKVFERVSQISDIKTITELAKQEIISIGILLNTGTGTKIMNTEK